MVSHTKAMALMSRLSPNKEEDFIVFGVKKRFGRSLYRYQGALRSETLILNALQKTSQQLSQTFAIGKRYRDFYLTMHNQYPKIKCCQDFPDCAEHEESAILRASHRICKRMALGGLPFEHTTSAPI